MNKLMFLFLCWLYRQNKKPFDFDETTKIIAHRGLVELYLENTKEALSKALKEDKIDGIEFDVQLSKDLVPVIFHDDDLVRLSSRNEFISDLSWDELQNILLTKQYVISSLEEVLSLLPKNKILNVELKDTILPFGILGLDRIINILLKYKNNHNIIVSSFSVEILEKFYSLNKDFELGLVIAPNMSIKKLIEYNKILPAITYIHPHLSLINKITSKIIKNLNVPLILWGHKKIGQEKPILEAKHFALITDIPMELNKCL